MKNPPHTIISTVGTSLLANLPLDLKDELRGGDAARRSHALRKAVAHLHDLTADKCGAEIDTLHLLHANGQVQIKASLYFCVSDTPDGKLVGDLLQAYYETEHVVKAQPLEGLQDRDPDQFRRQGLRSLVQTVGRIVRECGGPDHVCLNATGGYKAQIALAALMGQALGVTVYYKHERFPNIIAMPPMPIAFDYDLLGQEAPLLFALENPNEILKLPENYVVDERLYPLLEVETIDTTKYVSLTAVGQTFLEGYRLRFPPEKTLPPHALDKQRKGVHLGSHGYTPGFREYVHRVYDNSPYVIECQSRAYQGKRTIPGFRIEMHNDEIIGIYDSDKGETFSLETTARTRSEKLALVEDLNGSFRGR